eukprot:m.482360 g.482360  ORF g.482360 m.482360 type:complete len:373 (+) comp22525_c0_seq1:3687-4805(+)
MAAARAIAVVCLVLCVTPDLSYGMAVPSVPSVPLVQAAQPGVQMPAIGLGTGGYGSGFSQKWAYQATKEWLAAGGRRIDTALGYNDQEKIGQALGESGLKRSEVFITTKVPMVGNATETEFALCLEQLNNNTSGFRTDFVDLLLVHYPTPRGDVPDPACALPSKTTCRENAWRSLVGLLHKGVARAVGVSNFEVDHLTEIVDLCKRENLPLPAVNQIEFNPYWHEDKYGVAAGAHCPSPTAGGAKRELLEFTQAHKIVFNSYSPLGAPDVAPQRDGWNSSILELPLLTSMAEKHGCTAAQVVLAWHWAQGIVTNPRTHNQTHMQENLSYFDVKLSADELMAISTAIPIPHAPCPSPPDHCCNKVCSDYFGLP